MYPAADIPVLQISMPDLDPEHLFALGQRLAPLRDEGTLIVGSGFMTHGLPFVREYMMGRPGAPAWSTEFDLWAAEALASGDLDTLFAFRRRPPACPTRTPPWSISRRCSWRLVPRPTPDAAPTTAVEGYFMGLSKRSVELG